MLKEKSLTNIEKEQCVQNVIWQKKQDQQQIKKHEKQEHIAIKWKN